MKNIHCEGEESKEPHCQKLQQHSSLPLLWWSAMQGCSWPDNQNKLIWVWQSLSKSLDNENRLSFFLQNKYISPNLYSKADPVIESAKCITVAFYVFFKLLPVEKIWNFNFKSDLRMTCCIHGKASGTPHQGQPGQPHLRWGGNPCRQKNPSLGCSCSVKGALKLKVPWCCKKGGNSGALVLQDWRCSDTLVLRCCKTEQWTCGTLACTCSGATGLNVIWHSENGAPKMKVP